VPFIADESFDFARQVPYHTVRARPVIGALDLEPVAWHWTWERNGVLQVNSRFQKLTGCARRISRPSAISSSPATSSTAPRASP
jgi:hypothetical protein